MDPNEALARLRELCGHVRTSIGADLEDLADEITKLVADLDGWLSKGGFLPDAWSAQAQVDREQAQEDLFTAETEATPRDLYTEAMRQAFGWTVQEAHDTWEHLNG